MLNKLKWCWSIRNKQFESFTAIAGKGATMQQRKDAILEQVADSDMIVCEEIDGSMVCRLDTFK